MLASNFSELERLFQALGDKTRLRLLTLMAGGPVSVGFLADKLEESQPKVSRHLAYLRNAGIVYTERDGKWIYYGIRYAEDEVFRQILDNVVRSIAEMPPDDEIVFLTEEPVTAEAQFDPEYDTYAHTYESEVEDEGSTDEYESKTEEMDIFLL